MGSVGPSIASDNIDIKQNTIYYIVFLVLSREIILRLNRFVSALATQIHYFLM